MKTGIGVVLSIITLAGCDVIAPIVPPVPPAQSDVVCLWIGADKDTYASYGTSGSEADRNFGRDGGLVVAAGVLARKNSYVHFTPPTMPEGTEILEAKLELYHGGRNEDGYGTDDIVLNVGVIRNEPWSPLTLTWSNRPDRGGAPPSEFPLYLRSQAWSGTSDIAGAVRTMLSEPGTNYGFVISRSDIFMDRQVEKGFYSNNDYRRRQNDLGLSPRLLVKIKLPPGKTTADMSLGFLPADNDLGRIPQPITMVRFVGSNQWPADWDVTRN